MRESVTSKAPTPLPFTPTKPDLTRASFTAQTVPEITTSQAQPDLQTQLERVERFGHNFANIPIFASGTQLPPPPTIQPQLSIKHSGEQETAPLAVKMPNPAQGQSIQHQTGIDPVMQAALARVFQRSEKYLSNQSKGLDGGIQAQHDLESQLNGSKGRGSPLPDEVRSFMEPRFGADFSGVRVHTGSEAVQMNRELGAQAFAHGSDVYFGEGKSPGNNELTAHELTHVVQQGVSTSSSIQRECGVDESCMEEPNASYSAPSASYSEPNYTPASEEPNASYSEPNYTPASEEPNASYSEPNYTPASEEPNASYSEPNYTPASEEQNASYSEPNYTPASEEPNASYSEPSYTSADANMSTVEGTEVHVDIPSNAISSESEVDSDSDEVDSNSQSDTGFDSPCDPSTSSCPPEECKTLQRPKEKKKASETLMARLMGKYEKYGDHGENCIEKPYIAGSTEGNCTIGYGKLLQDCPIIDINTGEKPTPEKRQKALDSKEDRADLKCQCEERKYDCKGKEAQNKLEQEVKIKANHVNTVVPVDLNQAEFDALVDIALHHGSISPELLEAINLYWCTDVGKDYVRAIYLRSHLTRPESTKIEPGFVNRRKHRVWPASLPENK